MEPVSYTHLDVYKRQLLDRAVDAIELDIVGFESSEVFIGDDDLQLLSRKIEPEEELIWSIKWGSGHCECQLREYLYVD